MIHAFEKIDETFDRYRIILQGPPDEQRFGRVFRLDSTTHRLAAKKVLFQDGEVKRNAIELFMEPLPLSDIRRQSDDFTKLGLIELQELIDRFAIPLGKVEGRPDPTQDKLAMIEALREFKEPTKPIEHKPDVLIVPREIRELAIEGLHTRAAVEGVSIKGPGGKTLDRHLIEQKIAKKLMQKETVS